MIVSQQTDKCAISARETLGMADGKQTVEG